MYIFTKLLFGFSRLIQHLYRNIYIYIDIDIDIHMYIYTFYHTKLQIHGLNTLSQILFFYIAS